MQFTPSPNREGVGEAPSGLIQHDHGYLEYRYAPAFMCEVVNFEVDPNKRRCGYGTELLKSLLTILEPTNIFKIFLMTRMNNGQARGFYEKFGFTIINILPDFYNEHDNAVIYGGLVKPLLNRHTPNKPLLVCSLTNK